MIAQQPLLSCPKIALLLRSSSGLLKTLKDWASWLAYLNDPTVLKYCAVKKRSCTHRCRLIAKLRDVGFIHRSRTSYQAYSRIWSRTFSISKLVPRSSITYLERNFQNKKKVLRLAAQWQSLWIVPPASFLNPRRFCSLCDYFIGCKVVHLNNICSWHTFSTLFSRFVSIQEISPTHRCGSDFHEIGLSLK